MPLVGDYSERKVFKGDRCERIIVSAAKQSHKGAVPSLEPLTAVRELLVREFAPGTRKLICYCGECEGKTSVKDALGSDAAAKYVIMIGPEGDFSREEIALALEHGWTPVSLGDSRLRIETAALTATAAVYLSRL